MKRRLIIILALFLAISVGSWTYLQFFCDPDKLIKNGILNKDENEKSNALSNVASLSLVHINYDYKKSDYLINKDYIVVFNKEGKVIDTRAKEKGYDRESANNQYNMMIENESFYTNVTLKKDVLRYNTNYLNGSTLDEIKYMFACKLNYIYEEL